MVQGLSWSHVAEKVITRSEKQCRTKWLNYLNWKQKGGTEWTREDDLNLILRVVNLGASNDTEIDWNELSKGWKRLVHIVTIIILNIWIDTSAEPYRKSC